MNKEKLVNLGEEVLTDIDTDLEKRLRKHLEIELCRRLSLLFDRAGSFISQGHSKDASLESQKSHEAVKPVLDDCMDRLFPHLKTK